MKCQNSDALEIGIWHTYVDIFTKVLIMYQITVCKALIINDPKAFKCNFNV